MKNILLVVLFLVFASICSNAQTPCDNQYPTTFNDRSSLCDAADKSTTTLTGSVNSVATVLSVVSTTTFPATGVVVVDNEQMIFTATTHNTISISTRGAYGTTATSHTIGAVVKGALVAQHIHTQSDAQIAVEGRIGITASGEQSTPISGTLLAGRGAGTSSYRTPAQLGIPTLTGTSGVLPYYNGSGLVDSPFLRWGPNTVGFGAGSPAPPSTSNQLTGTRLLFLSGASGEHLGMGVESGALWTNIGSNNAYKYYWGADASTALHTVTASQYLVELNANAFQFTFNSSGSLSTGAFDLATNTSTLRFSAAGGYQWEINTNTFRPNNDNFHNLGDSTHRVKRLHTMETLFYGSTSGTTSLIPSAIAGTTVLTLPPVTDILAGLTATQTFTNKTLTSPAINLGSDANGDIYYRGSGVFARLPIGSNGNCLTVSSSLPAWAACSGSPGGSNTQLQFNNAGVFAGITGATSDGNTTTFGTGKLVATRPIVITSIDDSNGNKMLGVTATVSAVNYFQFANAATGTDPVFAPVGADSNIGFRINPKGNGSVQTLLNGGVYHVEGNNTGAALDLDDGSQTAELKASGRAVVRAAVDDVWLGDPDASDNGTNIHSNNATTRITLTAAGSGTILAVDNTTGIEISKTITAGGTTGARTINKPSGSVNFAMAATSLVVTNSMVTANSVIVCTVGTNDATMLSVRVVAGSGTFTIYANAAPTSETRVNFVVFN